MARACALLLFALNCLTLRAAPIPRAPMPDPFGNGYMGIRMSTDDTLVITSVTPGFPAEKAGLKSGDLILKIGDKALKQFSELGDTIYDCRPGTTVSVVVKRDGAEVTLSMLLATSQIPPRKPARFAVTFNRVDALAKLEIRNSHHQLIATHRHDDYAICPTKSPFRSLSMLLLRSMVLLACIALAPTTVRAEIKLHQLFGDHMVLQHGVNTNVWGTTAANTDVSVTLTKGDSAQVVQAKSNDKGEFIAKLPATKPGIGYTITVSSGEDKTKLEDVAFGEVWVCSGQSNMEWRFNLLRGGKTLAEQAVNKNIRLFTVPKTPAKDPQREIAKGAPYETKWLESNGESVFTFSAVGYYSAPPSRKPSTCLSV